MGGKEKKNKERMKERKKNKLTNKQKNEPNQKEHPRKWSCRSDAPENQCVIFQKHPEKSICWEVKMING